MMVSPGNGKWSTLITMSVLQLPITTTCFMFFIFPYNDRNVTFFFILTSLHWPLYENFSIIFTYISPLMTKLFSTFHVTYRHFQSLLGRNNSKIMYLPTRLYPICKIILSAILIMFPSFVKAQQKVYPQRFFYENVVHHSTRKNLVSVPIYRLLPDSSVVDSSFTSRGNNVMNSYDNYFFFVPKSEEH